MVKLSGFSGQDHYFLDMVEFLLASTPVLENMIVTSKLSMESLESSLPQGRGKWTARHATDDAAITSEYEWTPNMEMFAVNGAGDVSQYIEQMKVVN